MALTARVARVTEAEFLALPESNEKVELIDGEVVMSPSATYRHRMFSKRIVDRLSAWVRENRTSHVVLYSPLDVRLGPGRIVQPDIVVFERPLPLDVAMPIDTRPLLCVEILSSNRIYDRVTKRMLYAAAGVPEFWCVEQTGEVERFSGDNLGSADRCDDRLATPLFPGFDLDLQTLLEP